MIITNQINVYLHKKEQSCTDAVHGDTARVLGLFLHAGGSEWNLPEGTKVQLRFRKPDGTGGVYDTLPDGSCAYEISGNKVALALAPQVLTVPGVVEAQAVILWGAGELATFTIKICVQENPALGVLESKDFVNLSDWVSAQVKSYLKNEQDELRDLFATPGALFVNVAYSADSDTGYVSDKTYEEIYKAAPGLGSALDGERPVYCVLWSVPTFSSRDYVILPLSSHDPVLKQYIFTRMDNGLELSVHISETATWVKWWSVARKSDIPSVSDGVTPHIGENGNWWIGEEDTGVKAAGEDGSSVYSMDLVESQSDETKSVYNMYDDGDRTIGSFTVHHGKNGHTPVKGVDYFTEEDKTELTVSLSQIEAPQIVSSVAEMTDITKHYVLDGYIYSNKTIVTEGETTSPNVFIPSTASLNKRMSGSSGSMSAKDGHFVTDFIEVKNFASTTPYTVRLNWELASVSDDVKAVFYDSSKTKIGYTILGNEGYATPNTWISDGKTVCDIKTILSGTEPAASEVAFVKFQLAVDSSLAPLTSDDIANCEITFDANNVVGESTTNIEWVNSGISYTPTFKTDLIGVLGEDNVIYLSENLPSGTYTLKYGNETYDTIGTITIG